MDRVFLNICKKVNSRYKEKMVVELVHGSMCLKHIGFNNVKLVSQLQDFLEPFTCILRVEL